MNCASLEESACMSSLTLCLCLQIARCETALSCLRFDTLRRQRSSGTQDSLHSDAPSGTSHRLLSFFPCVRFQSHCACKSHNMAVPCFKFSVNQTNHGITHALHDEHGITFPTHLSNLSYIFQLPRNQHIHSSNLNRSLSHTFSLEQSNIKPT